ncbi:hypothetical protein BFD15_05485 [Morganella morganii]|nr:hypothetical protein BFD15_05485 [Morganella morganii]
MLLDAKEWKNFASGRQIKNLSQINQLKKWQTVFSIDGKKKAKHTEACLSSLQKMDGLFIQRDNLN